MKRTARQLMVIALTGAAALAMAGDATWNQTATSTSYNWNDVNNWLPNTTFPNGAGQTAGMAINIAGAQTIRLRQNITVGTLNVGDSATTAYNMTINNSGTETFALTFDSNAAGVPATIRLSSAGTPTIYLNAPASLNSDLVVDLAGVDSSNRQVLNLQNVTAMNGHTIMFTNGVYNAGSQLTFDTVGDFTGSGTVVLGSSATGLVNGKKTFGGTVIVNGRATGSNAAALTLTNGGFTNAAEVVINGWFSDSNVREGGAVHSGSGTGAAANPGQRQTRRRITFNGGSLACNGQPATAGATDWGLGLEWVRDDVATMDFNSGYSYFAMGVGGNTMGTIVDVTTLERSAGASVYLFGQNDANKCFFATNYTAFLVGAGGGAGTTTMSMVPWMAVYAGGSFVYPAGFATYAPGKGFRALSTSTEYSTSLTAGAAHNVSVNNLALAADATVNSLRFTLGSGSNMGAGRTLTVASGGVFFSASKGSIGVPGSALAGTLNFGSAEGVFWTITTHTCTNAAKITGTGGITKACTGSLTLTGANDYSGTTHVGGGTLRVGDGTNPSNLGTGNVDVHAGATLRLSCANAIADDATVSLYQSGPYKGRMTLDAGIDETVKELRLGGVAQPAGTYGSSTSAATYKLNDFFTGTGIITVPAAADRGFLMIVY